MPTMLDVARRVGVSLSTVSYALSGTRPISEATRQRIFAAMEELGYRPHALARGLASKRSRILALLFPTAERGLGATELEFVAGAAEAALDNGYHLVLWPTRTPGADELQQLIGQGLVDGVILMEVYLHDERIRWLRQQQFPFSMIGRSADAEEPGYVDIDFEQTLGDVVSYLAELGHRRIAFLNHSRARFEAGYGPAIRAQKAFTLATRAAGLAGAQVFCPASPQAAHEVCGALFAEHPDVTALVAMNDRALPGILRAADDRGWRISEDFSLISIVTSARLADMMTPPLTVAEPPSAELGRLSVELLIQQLETGARNVSQQLIPCRLVVRGSSGPCRRSAGPAPAQAGSCC